MIILDTFNKAPESLANWIEGSFLAGVAEADNIKVIIVGQNIPNPTIEWSSVAETYHLDNIIDIEAWVSFVDAQELNLPRDAVMALVIATQGMPAQTRLLIESVAKKWKL